MVGDVDIDAAAKEGHHGEGLHLVLLDELQGGQLPVALVVEVQGGAHVREGAVP